MMGRAGGLDRVAQGLIALVALFALANGAFMLADPFGWYQAVETVKFTGPPNQHFIRDIGIAYAVSGLVLGFAGFNLSMRWLAAVTGNLWLTAHGALHAWEGLTGICAPDVFWRDAPGVLGPPLIVWVAIAIQFARQRVAPAGLPDRLFLGAVDRMTPDEAEYIHRIARAPGGALEKFKHFMPVTMHRHAAPAEPFHMARIGASLIEDCGPCAMIAAQGALADGVSRDLVNAALAAKLPEGELGTAFAFGQAIALHAQDAAPLGDAVEAIWGQDTRLELAMTAATTRAYPAIKRGLGLGKPCGLEPMKV